MATPELGYIYIYAETKHVTQLLSLQQLRNSYFMFG